MRILYSVQATGNGHISRAMELLPYLQRYGTVDIFLSGANSTLQPDLPVKYRSRGLCIYYNHRGGLAYGKTIRNFSPVRMAKEIRDLPVENYDLVLNDFESITALACALKRIPSVNFGHQASFRSEKTPRPAKQDPLGEWILRNYARASQYIGLHFASYDDFILPPVIRREIRNAEPADLGHVTVYLPSYSDGEIAKWLSPIKDFRFQVFSRERKTPCQQQNLEFIPVSKDAFTKSMIGCKGILTGAGFETPAEALWLGKKLMVIPIGGQYEQYCNAEALRRMGVVSLRALGHDLREKLIAWMHNENQVRCNPGLSTEAIVEYVMNHSQPKLPAPDIIFHGLAAS